MLSAIVLALSPFLLNVVMAIIKWLTPTESTAWKRGVLALLSLAGVIATSAMTGTPVNPNEVSSLLTAIVEAFVAFLLAHGSYTLFWNKPNKRNS